MAADWPQWRGPARDDISTETGLLKQWPSSGPALVWKATGLGTGFSSVSVAAGRIYTMGDGTDSSYVYALDEATGKQIWSAKVGAIGGGNGFPGTRSTPTVNGDSVFALGQFGDLVCLESATGKERWRHNLEKDLAGKMMSGWGYSESPLLDGDKLVCTPGGASGTLAALNAKTGAVVWRTADLTDNATYASLVVANIGGVRQYVVLTDANVAGVNPSDGKVLWKAARPGKTAVIPTPVVDGNLVYVTSGYAVGSNLFQVDYAGGKFSAHQVYAEKEMPNKLGGVVKIGNAIFGFADGKGWTCQEFKTGKILWVDKDKLGAGSLTAADGNLYLRQESGPGAGAGPGTVVLLEPTLTGWSEKGRFDQPDRSQKADWPHPVVSNGHLYLRDQDTLLAYDVKAH